MMASLVAASGCVNNLEELDHEAHQARPSKEVITVSVEAVIDDSDRGMEEYLMSLWQWVEGDVAYAVYESEGMQDVCASRSINIDDRDASKAVITFDRIPFDARILAVEVGDRSVYGQESLLGHELTRDMTYLRGDVEAEEGQTEISGVTLVNQCRYLLLNLSDISVHGISFETRKVLIAAAGLYGGDGEDVISFEYSKEMQTEKVLVAISRKASSLAIDADFASGEKHILDIDSLEDEPLIVSVNDVPDNTERMTVTVSATLDVASRDACTDPELSAMAKDLWTWKSDDTVYATVEIYGYRGKIPCDVVNVDASDANKAQIVFDKIPAESVIKEISIGNENSYGRMGKTVEGIDRGMIYASVQIVSSAGASTVDNVDLKHQCSYLNVQAEYLEVDGVRHDVRSVSVSGAGVRNDGKPVIIPLFSEPSSDSWWVSVSNETTLLSVVASYDDTAALLYSREETPETASVMKIRTDSPQKAVFRTVLFADGTFIINQISAYANMDKALHGDEVAVYPPLDRENDYVFLDQSQPYVYLEGEEVPTDERDIRHIIDDLRNIEDVETYFKTRYGDDEGKKMISPLWEQEKELIKTVQFGSTLRPKSMNVWFRGCTNLTDVDVSGLDLSQCKGLWGTFMGCSDLNNIDVSEWNLASVETVSQIFNGCSSVENLDVKMWNTGNISSFSKAFEGCERVRHLEVASWDMSKAETIRYIFAKCKSLTSIDVADWNVSNVGNFVGAFEFCASLERLDVSRWNTSSAYNSFFKVFCDCTLLQELDLRSWNISGVREFDNMFSRCSSIKTIDLRGWKSASIERCPNMFRQCFALESVYTDEDFDLTKLFFSVTKGMFYQCSSLKGGLGTMIPEDKLQSDINPECSGRHYGRVDMIAEDGTHMQGVFTLKK